MTKPAEVTTSDFQEKVLNSTEPVLVDFWAPWCAPCRFLSPIVEELAGEYEGKISFLKLNTDNDPSIAQKYNIFSIPTVIVFKGGEPVKQLVGLRPKRDLKSSLDEVLAT